MQSTYDHQILSHAPGQGKEFGGGLNTVDKRYIYQLISKVQIPG